MLGFAATVLLAWATVVIDAGRPTGSGSVAEIRDSVPMSPGLSRWTFENGPATANAWSGREWFRPDH
ncbi:MAG: hypothetical protein SGJ09_09400 [Phycisphaerae bacterium]|nr:hypothetical protein [Phycisphaerae bacterium]